MKGIPRITEGVVVTPVETPEGLSYRLRSPLRGAGTIVPARTAVPLLLMDGKRTLAEVHQATQAQGIKISDPSRFLALLSVLEAAGVVSIQHHYVTPYGEPVRHGCEGCGQSCEGHLVGPIEAAEGKVLAARLAELRADDATIPNQPAVLDVTFGGQTQPVLNFVDGACIFLDSHKRCRLHARWGSTAKPLPCRMFPFRMVRTETGTRVAISPRCFQAHHSYETTPPIAVDSLLKEWGVWRPPSLVQGLDPTRDDSLLPTASAEVNRTHEEAVLGMLEDPSAPPDLAVLLASLRVWVSDPAAEPRATPPPTVGTEPRRRFGRAVLAAQHEVFSNFSLATFQRPTGFGLSVAALVKGVLALEPSGLADWWDLPSPAARYVRHCIRHLVFAREVMQFGSVRAGVLALAMGTMAARWLVDRESLEAGRLDAFVQHQTAWIRLCGAPELQAIIFPPPSGADALLGLLWSSWS